MRFQPSPYSRAHSNPDEESDSGLPQASNTAQIISAFAEPTVAITKSIVDAATKKKKKGKKPPAPVYTPPPEEESSGSGTVLLVVGGVGLLAVLGGIAYVVSQQHDEAPAAEGV